MGHVERRVLLCVQEAPHARFKREGADLVISLRVPLKDALCGGSFGVPHLDGSTVPVTIAGPIQPGGIQTIR